VELSPSGRVSKRVVKVNVVSIVDSQSSVGIGGCWDPSVPKAAIFDIEHNDLLLNKLGRLFLDRNSAQDGKVPDLLG